MKNEIKLAVLAIIVLVIAIGATGCVSTPTNNPATAPVATATAQATVAPTKTPTAAPATQTDNNITGLESHWIGKGYTISTHFVKTTVDGKTAYKGTVTDSTGSYKVTDVLTSTDTEAASYADTTLAQYEARGFTVQSDNNNHQYTVLSGSTYASISGYSVVYGTTSPGVGIVEEA